MTKEHGQEDRVVQYQKGTRAKAPVLPNIFLTITCLSFSVSITILTFLDQLLPKVQKGGKGTEDVSGRGNGRNEKLHNVLNEMHPLIVVRHQVRSGNGMEMKLEEQVTWRLC